MSTLWSIDRIRSHECYKVLSYEWKEVDEIVEELERKYSKKIGRFATIHVLQRLKYGGVVNSKSETCIDKETKKRVNLLYYRKIIPRKKKKTTIEKLFKPDQAPQPA